MSTNVVVANVSLLLQAQSESFNMQVTRLERTMNLLVAMVFAVQVIWSVLASIGNYLFLTSHEPQHWYLRSTG